MKLICWKKLKDRHILYICYASLAKFPLNGERNPTKKIKRLTEVDHERVFHSPHTPSGNFLRCACF